MFGPTLLRVLMFFISLGRERESERELVYMLFTKLYVYLACISFCLPLVSDVGCGM